MSGEAGALPVQDVLRHDLRTELNHVVGYAELLLDEMEVLPLDLLDRLLQDLCAHARRAASIEATPSEVAASIAAVADAVAELRSRLPSDADEVLIRDVKRIEIAAANAGRMIAVLRQRQPVDAVPSAVPSPVPSPMSSSPMSSPMSSPISSSPMSSPMSSSPMSSPMSSSPMSSPPMSSPVAPPRQSPDLTPVEPSVILVVDDDADNCDLLARRLERLDYAVVVAENGHQALGVLECEPVDLVLLDLMMPEMDGETFLAHRQTDDRLRDIPVVMISSESEAASIARCIEMGADDYLPKPFEPVLLHARVSACLEKKRLRDQEKALLAQLVEWNIGLEERIQAQVEEIERLARLRRFLSPQVADVVVSSASGDFLGTHRREIAVLFCDLRGFTTFSETAEPEEVMDVLREYHHVIGTLTHEFEATVGFFAGDGIMVFFNDPLPCPNPAEQAVRMAVVLRDRMETMTRDWLRRGHQVGFGVGISLGYATLGEIGFEGRYEYGVIGSVVNLASRLCDQARHGQILLSQRAYNAVAGGLAQCEEIDGLTLKGFRTPVGVFSVLGLEAPVGTTKER